MDQISISKSIPDPVKQFSVFTENKVGKLSDLIKYLVENQVHVMALTTLDTSDSAILRMVVDDPQKSRRLLRDQGFAFVESEILAVEIDGEHELTSVLRALLEVEVNVHYMYSFVSRPMGKGALALSIEDMDIAEDILNTRNIKLLSQRDISR